MKFGTCKYGATCKFDHPPPREDVAKAITMAATTKDTSADYDKIDTGNVGTKATNENIKDWWKLHKVDLGLLFKGRR